MAVWPGLGICQHRDLAVPTPGGCSNQKVQRNSVFWIAHHNVVNIELNDQFPTIQMKSSYTYLPKTIYPMTSHVHGATEFLNPTYETHTQEIFDQSKVKPYLNVLITPRIPDYSTCTTQNPYKLLSIPEICARMKYKSVITMQQDQSKAYEKPPHLGPGRWSQINTEWISSANKSTPSFAGRLEKPPGP